MPSRMCSCFACLTDWLAATDPRRLLFASIVRARNPPERQCDSRKNKVDMLHPIIFPAIYNINVCLACKMQSGVSNRRSVKATAGWSAGAITIECTTFNRQGTFFYLIYSRAT